MDLLIQPNSIGIRYDGYDDEFKECVFEDSNVSGRNERYEFRCRPDLECCGRTCCIPQESVIPLWYFFTVDDTFYNIRITSSSGSSHYHGMVP
ncbi:unnamed protein product [Onchocerca flexuosa]|uniref:CX domain-containing protein n=1 Tax=Onchocerca flexuosa TaxID=387005 RepID=A0A183HHA7_9BILA|nr:unnamed protein product [Onchocerca flexuosa]